MPRGFHVRFFGSDDVSLRSLQAILSLGKGIHASVVCGAADGPVHRFCARHAVPHVVVPPGTPFTLTDDLAVPESLPRAPDITCVVSFGHKLPSSAIADPRIAAINAHPSILPRHAGAAPIEGALIAGDAATGVTVQGVDPGTIDAGAALSRSHRWVRPWECGRSLRARLAEDAARLVAECVASAESGAFADLESSAAPAVAPPSVAASRTRRIRRDASRLDPLCDGGTAQVIGTFRALRGGAGAWFDFARPVGRAIVTEADPLMDDEPSGETASLLLSLAEEEDPAHVLAGPVAWDRRDTCGGSDVDGRVLEAVAASVRAWRTAGPLAVPSDAWEPGRMTPPASDEDAWRAILGSPVLWAIQGNAIPRVAGRARRDQMRERLASRAVDPGHAVYDKVSKCIAVRCSDGWALARRFLVPSKGKEWDAATFANATGLRSSKESIPILSSSETNHQS